MRWTTLLTVAVLAALAFGGSFTCTAHSGDDHDHKTTAPSR